MPAFKSSNWTIGSHYKYWQAVFYSIQSSLDINPTFQVKKPLNIIAALDDIAFHISIPENQKLNLSASYWVLPCEQNGLTVCTRLSTTQVVLWHSGLCRGSEKQWILCNITQWHIRCGPINHLTFPEGRAIVLHMLGHLTAMKSICAVLEQNPLHHDKASVYSMRYYKIWLLVDSG